MHVLVKNSFVHIEILVLEMLGGFPAGTFWGRSCGCSHRGAVLRQMVPFEGILVVTFFSMLVFVCVLHRMVRRFFHKPTSVAVCMDFSLCNGLPIASTCSASASSGSHPSPPPHPWRLGLGILSSLMAQRHKGHRVQIGDCERRRSFGWHYCPKKLTWLRAAFSPWWKQEVAQTTRKQKPIVPALREKHYRAVLPDKHEVEVPGGWLKASLPNSVGSLRGAGDGCGLCLPPSTPSCKSGSCKTGKGALSLPSATPCRKSCKSSCVKRAEAVTSEARLSLPDCTPISRSTKKASPSLHALEFQSDVGTCLTEADIDLAVGAEDSFPSSRIWTCKICSCKFESCQKGRQLSDLRTRHLASRHPDVDPATVPGIQESILLTKVSAKVPLGIRAWTCPFCNGGLPHGLTPYAIKAAVRSLGISW